MKKQITFLLILFILLCGCQKQESNQSAPTSSTAPKIGIYQSEGSDLENGPFYSVTISKYENQKVTLSVSYAGEYLSPLYTTTDIDVTLKEDQGHFTWKDSWDNEGDGTIVIEDEKTIILNMEIKKEADLNRATLETKDLKLTWAMDIDASESDELV